MFNSTYKNQSTVNIRATISEGKPTVSSTISMVTNPACGMAAAPIEAKIDVKLKIPTKLEKCLF